MRTSNSPCDSRELVWAPHNSYPDEIHYQADTLWSNWSSHFLIYCKDYLRFEFAVLKMDGVCNNLSAFFFSSWPHGWQVFHLLDPRYKQTCLLDCWLMEREPRTKDWSGWAADAQLLTASPRECICKHSSALTVLIEEKLWGTIDYVSSLNCFFLRAVKTRNGKGPLL